MEWLRCTLESAVSLTSRSWRSLVDVNTLRVRPSLGELHGEILWELDRAASSLRFRDRTFPWKALGNKTGIWRDVLKFCSDHIALCRVGLAIRLNLKPPSTS